MLARDHSIDGGSELEACAMDSAACGGLLNLDDPGNVSDGEPDNLLEDERDSELVGEARDFPLYAFTRLLPDLLLECIVLFAWNDCYELIAERKEILERADVVRLARAFAMHALACACGDGVEPCLFRGVVAKGVPGAEGLKEYFLDEIFGFLRGGAESAGELVEGACVFGNEAMRVRVVRLVSREITLATGGGHAE